MLKEKAPKFIAEEIDEEGSLIRIPKEVDEKYYGPRTYWQHNSKKKKGTQGRSLVNKTPILGILDRSGQVYTEVVPNTKRETIVPIIQRVVEPGATIDTDEHLPYRTLKQDYNHDHINHM